MDLQQTVRARTPHAAVRRARANVRRMGLQVLDVVDVHPGRNTGKGVALWVVRLIVSEPSDTSLPSESWAGGFAVNH